MILLGLTGSIGMGKSTTAGMFAAEGVPVNDADQVVHSLYLNEAVSPVGQAFPGTIREGAVDRQELSRQLARDPEKFKLLEQIVHPLVREKERQFVEDCRRRSVPLAVLDIPLLFETGGEKRVDRVAVVTCDPAEQKRRVLARPGMTEEKFALILSRQVTDAEKRARADFIIDTGYGLDHARKQVQWIIQKLTGEQTDA